LFSIGMPVVMVGGKAAALAAPTEAVLAADLQVLRRKALHPSHWLRFLTFKSDYRLLWSVTRESIRRAMLGTGARKPKPEQPAVDPDTAVVPMFLDRNFVRAIFAMAESGRSSLLLFGGGDRYLSEYQEYFAGSYAARLATQAERIHLRIVPEANHVLDHPEWIDEAQGIIAGWLEQDILLTQQHLTTSDSASWRVLRSGIGAIKRSVGMGADNE
jgi:hypothetical protein